MTRPSDIARCGFDPVDVLEDHWYRLRRCSPARRTAAMSVLNRGVDLRGEQFNPSQKADCAMAFVLVITCEGSQTSAGLELSLSPGVAKRGSGPQIARVALLFREPVISCS